MRVAQSSLSQAQVQPASIRAVPEASSGSDGIVSREPKLETTTNPIRRAPGISHSTPTRARARARARPRRAACHPDPLGAAPHSPIKNEGLAAASSAAHSHYASPIVSPVSTPRAQGDGKRRRASPSEGGGSRGEEGRHRTRTLVPRRRRLRSPRGTCLFPRSPPVRLGGFYRVVGSLPPLSGVPP